MTQPGRAQINEFIQRFGQERDLAHQLRGHDGLGHLPVESGGQGPLTMRRARVGGEGSAAQPGAARGRGCRRRCAE